MSSVEGEKVEPDATCFERSPDVGSIAMSDRKIWIDKKDLRGSRLRCLMLTAAPDGQFARHLTELVQPYGVVNTGDRRKPRGFLSHREAKLGETPEFLTERQRESLMDWWLVNRGGNTNIPNWDLVCTAEIDGMQGLVLVEAKAHGNELKQDDRSGSGDPENRARIEGAIQEANAGLEPIVPGWSLSRDSHYQLSNRFAWSWKIAELGVPVVLVYLGFLNAEEMIDQGPTFHSAREWNDVVQTYAHGVVPDEIWGTRVETLDAPFRAIIRAMDLHWEVQNN